MPRGRKALAAPAAHQDASALPPVSRPIAVDRSQMEILDLYLFKRLEGIGALDEAGQQALIIEAIPMLDRLIVGGLAGFRADEFGAVLAHVGAQLRASQKN